VRWSTAKAFLRPARSRPNLEVLTGAQATRIAFDGRRAVGLHFRRNGGDCFAAVRGELLLAAGAIGSPQLLQLAGVGPGDLLREQGVPVVHALAGVGQNLQDHLQLRLVYRVENTRTLNEDANRLLGRARMGLQYLLFRRGPLTMAPSQLGAFAKSDPSRETPNLEYHVQPLSLDKFGDPLHPFPAFTASVCNLRPESRGHVQITSPDPAAPPAIRPNYLATEADRMVAADAIRLTRRICAAKALARFAPQEYRPGAEFQSEAELAQAAGAIGTTIFHPVGTCRMGGDAMAVVDERLRLHGVFGLRVIDAGVMPTITSGNPNAPVIMIAEKAADMIKADRRQTAVTRSVADRQA
jgi:choline dehydrogenase